jgi:hypothetical protein
LATDEEEAKRILQKKDVAFDKEDQYMLKTDFVINYGTTKEDVLKSLENQKAFINDSDEPERKELEQLWYIEDRLKNLIEDGE